jgi:hypothetical protein
VGDHTADGAVELALPYCENTNPAVAVIDVAKKKVLASASGTCDVVVQLRRAGGKLSAECRPFTRAKTDDQQKPNATRLQTRTTIFRARVRLFTEAYRPELHPTFARRMSQPPLTHQMPEIPVWGAGRSPGSSMKAFNDTKAAVALDHWVTIGGGLWFGSEDTICTESFPQLVKLLDRKGFIVGRVNGFHPDEAAHMLNMSAPNCSAGMAAAEAILGPRFLGTSSTEEGGRWNNMPLDGQLALASIEPAIGEAGRHVQRSAWSEYYEREFDYIGRKVTQLSTSTDETHLVAETGFVTLVGTESSQGYGNDQIMYAVNRGAAKQHGIALGAGVSVSNGFGGKVPLPGWPTVNQTQCDDDPTRKSGPSCGTSLSLMKRLLVHEILYGATTATIEDFQFCGPYCKPYCDAGGEGGLGVPTAIGRLQKRLYTFFRELTRNGSDPIAPLGGATHVATFAVIHDGDVGWQYPCSNAKNTWQHGPHGFILTPFRNMRNAPWRKADYFLDGVLDTVYPGYAVGRYGRDERGYLSPTPHGDTLDFLLDDAPEEVLRRYDTLIVTGTMRRTPRAMLRRLSQLIASGGNVIITADALAALSGPLLGIEAAVGAACVQFRAGTTVIVQMKSHAEPRPFSLCPLYDRGGAHTTEVVAHEAASKQPLALRAQAASGGSLLVLAAGNSSTSQRGGGKLNYTTYQCTAEQLGDKPTSITDVPRPFPLLVSTRAVLGAALRERTLFDVEPAGTKPSLTWSASALDANATGFLLAISNPSFDAKPFKVQAGPGLPAGTNLVVTGIALDDAERRDVGFAPAGVTAHDATSATAISGGDIKVFRVTVGSDAVAVLPPADERTATQGRNTWLRLNGGRTFASVDDAILQRPSLVQDFSGLVLPWRYVFSADDASLARDASTAANRKVELAVDATEAIVPFPYFRLSTESEAELSRSVAGLSKLIRKCGLLNAKTLILSLHKIPEFSKQSPAELENGQQRTLRALAALAENFGVTIHIRDAHKNLTPSIGRLASFVEGVGSRFVRVAPSTALMLKDARPAMQQDYHSLFTHRNSSLLLLSADISDDAGTVYSSNGPIAALGDTWDESVPRLPKATAIAMVHAVLASAREAGATVVLDAAFSDRDDELADVDALRQLERQRNTLDTDAAAILPAVPVGR